MALLIKTLEIGGSIVIGGALVYMYYRYARWNWESRNKDMKAGIETLFGGKK